MSMLLRILKRGHETVVLGDVVGCRPEISVEFLDERALLVFDADPVAGRAGIPARPAVDIRDDGHSDLWHGSRGFTLADEVEDPLATIALDDRRVAADLVEYLRPQAYVADGAQAVLCLGDSHASAPLGDGFERAEDASIDFRDEFLARLRATVDLGLQRRKLRVERRTLGGDLLLRRLQLG